MNNLEIKTVVDNEQLLAKQFSFGFTAFVSKYNLSFDAAYYESQHAVLTRHKISFMQLPGFSGASGGYIDFNEGDTIYFLSDTDTFAAYIILLGSFPTNNSIKSLTLFNIMGDEVLITSTGNPDNCLIYLDIIRNGTSKVIINTIDESVLSKFMDMIKEAYDYRKTREPIINNEHTQVSENIKASEPIDGSNLQITRKRKKIYGRDVLNSGVFSKPNGRAWVIRREFKSWSALVVSDATEKMVVKETLSSLRKKFNACVGRKRTVGKICMNINDDSYPRFHDSECFCITRGPRT